MQLLKVLARVLEYPTEELQASQDALVAAVLEDSRLPRQNKEQLLRCVEKLCDGDLLDLQEAYVAPSIRPGDVPAAVRTRARRIPRPWPGHGGPDGAVPHQWAGDRCEGAAGLPALFLEYLSTRPWDEIRNWLEDIHHILGLLGERLYQRESFYHVVMDSLLMLSGRTADRQELARSWLRKSATTPRRLWTKSGKRKW